MKVAVVWNNDRSGVVSAFGRPCPEQYGAKTLQRVVDALEEGGHEVLLCEGDKHLIATLERFMPPDDAGHPTGMVFNMAYGIQGECRYTHVPAMLEMAGIPYTGSDPLGHALALDKVVTKHLIRSVGIPTPDFRVMRRGDESRGDLHFPLVVKPRHESTSFGLQLVEDPSHLRCAVESVVEQYQQDALVEEYIDGREVCVAILGNDPAELLPLVEQDFGTRRTRLVTREDKVHRGTEVEPEKICPAVVDDALAARLGEISLATFRACRCKDFARVDIRLDAAGSPYVLEINSMAALGPTASFVLAARVAGYGFVQLVNNILATACRRYGYTSTSRERVIA